MCPASIFASHAYWLISSPSLLEIGETERESDLLALPRVLELRRNLVNMDHTYTIILSCTRLTNSTGVPIVHSGLLVPGLETLG